MNLNTVGIMSNVENYYMKPSVHTCLKYQQNITEKYT